jgi:hypothetical protein
MKLQQELALISFGCHGFHGFWNAHIAAMLGVKLSHFGVLRICRFSPFHQPLENTGFRQGTISHATHSVYGNKIVVGYEDDENHYARNGGDECSEVRRLNLKKNSKSQF